MTEFVNDLSLAWLRPVSQMVRGAWRRLRQTQLFARQLRAFEERGRCTRLVARRRPVLIFLRGRVPRMRLLFRRRHAIGQVRTGSDYLREIVHHFWDSGEEVSLVPIAVLRGRGMRRKESRLATLVYSVQEVPSDMRKLYTYVWNRNDLFITVGKEVALGEFRARYANDSEERVVRRLTRALQWTSAAVMITVAGLIAFDQTRVVNTIVFSILSAFGSNPDSAVARL